MSWYKPGERAVYLYDGVYAEDLGHEIILSAQREGGVHFVCLEGYAIQEFLRFLENARGIKIEVTKPQERE